MVFIKCARDQTVPEKEKGFTTYNVIIFLETTKISQTSHNIWSQKEVESCQNRSFCSSKSFLTPKGALADRLFKWKTYMLARICCQTGFLTKTLEHFKLCLSQTWYVCLVETLSQHVIAIYIQNPTGTQVWNFIFIYFFHF